MKTQTLSILLTLATIGCSSKFNDNDGDITGGADDTGADAADEGDEDQDDDEEDDLDGDGVTAEDGDCDDEDENVNPDAEEICDGIDNDCDDVIDETFDALKEVYFEDADDDEFGNPEVSQEFCPEQDKDGWVTDNTDCDDTRANVYPGATEDFNDEIDNDCDEDIDERFDITDIESEDLLDDVNYGTPSSIAVDEGGAAHIAFEGNGDVMYTKVTESGASTEPEIVSEDGGGTVWSSGEFIDAEVDEVGRVHIGYVSTFEYSGDASYVQRELHYALGGAGLGWTVDMVEGDAAAEFDLGQFVDIEVHEAAIVGTTATFAYLDADNGNAKVADVLVSGGEPIITTVGSGFPEEWTGGALPPSAQYTSLGISSDGTHYVAWYDPNAGLTLTPQIQYTQYTWDPGAVFPDAFDPFAFDFSGIDLGALIPSDISIEQTLVETETNGMRLEVTNGADDTAETPCVTYVDTNANALKFGCADPTTAWAVAMETLPIGDYTPSQPAFAINAGDEFFISFYNETERDLMLASKRKGSDWEIITVDSDGDVGQASSIATGIDGSIHISYYDATNGMLRYARGF